MSENKMPAEIKRYLGIISDKDNTQQKLKTWQKQALLLHLEGYPATEIAEMVHKAPSSVRRAIQSDEAKVLIQDYYNFLDAEYESLYKLSLNAMRDSLSDTAPLELRFKAAKFFLEKKADKQQAAQAASEDQSAEGIIQKIINIYNYNQSPSDDNSNQTTISLPSPPQENDDG
jgi:hypothetical protein